MVGPSHVYAMRPVTVTTLGQLPTKDFMFERLVVQAMKERRVHQALCYDGPASLGIPRELDLNDH